MMKSSNQTWKFVYEPHFLVMKACWCITVLYSVNGKLFNNSFFSLFQKPIGQFAMFLVNVNCVSVFYCSIWTIKCCSTPTHFNKKWSQDGLTFLVQFLLVWLTPIQTSKLLTVRQLGVLKYNIERKFVSTIRTFLTEKWTSRFWNKYDNIEIFEFW